MNVFYEESGSFKVGSIVSRNDASLQVDTQHGKRAKLKAANVFLEFSSALQDFLPAAEAIAADIDVDTTVEDPEKVAAAAAGQPEPAEPADPADPEKDSAPAARVLVPAPKGLQ